jgi:nucleotide-binding universal stress UspA family protein
MREKEMNMRHSIVSGVDGSEESRVAATVAADLAQELDLRLVIVYAADDPPTFPYGDLRLTELQRRRDVQAVQRLLDTTARSLSVVPETRMVYGNPVDALNMVATEEEARLLVVGSRGRSGIAAALSGSVSTRLASESVVPVLVVSDEAGARFLAGDRTDGAVVTGVDGSLESTRALRLGADLADRTGRPLLPVYAAGRRTDDLPPEAVGMPVKTELGEPVDVLRSRALNADARLIVVGSRGRGPLRGALLGSVSASLAASAPAPVLVVPRTAELIGLGGDVAAGLRAAA